MPARAHESNPVTPVKLIPSSSELWVKSAETHGITLPLLKKLKGSLTSPAPEFHQQVKPSSSLILKAFSGFGSLCELLFCWILDLWSWRLGLRHCVLSYLAFLWCRNLWMVAQLYRLTGAIAHGGRKRHKWGYRVQNPDNCNFPFKVKFLACKYRLVVCGHCLLICQKPTG